MSTQRYVPRGDRSPPRSGERIHPDRASNFASSPATRDSAPPSASRPLYAGSSYTPRGRGFAPRATEYRPDYREREPIRDRRDTSPYSSVDRDRTWRDRDSDRGRSPPRREREVRDFRDAPRGRGGRRGSFDSDIFPPSRGRGFTPGPPSRGSSGRGRGRGDWDSRGRGRGGFALDDRTERPDLFRPRSRSPGRDRSRWPDDDRSIGRRDDYRPANREDRLRDSERYRDASPEPRSSLAGRRPSLPSISVSMNSASTSSSHQAQSARPYESRDPRDNPLRRSSTMNIPESQRDNGREALRTTTDTPARSHASSAAALPSQVNSPPKPTEIPAFGSVPVKGVQQEGWNIWRAPTEPKAARPPSTTTTSAPPSDPVRSAEPSSRPDLVPQPPTAPRADRMSFQGPSDSRSGVNPGTPQSLQPSIIRTSAQVPTAPAAERDAGPSPALARSPPTGPRFPNTPMGPRIGSRPDAPVASARSPPIVAAIPTGPRSSVSSLSSSGAIPTGPRAERTSSAQAAARPPPMGPAAMSAWQRNRVAPVPPVVPSKRDHHGEIKDYASASPQQAHAREGPPLKPAESATEILRDKPKPGGIMANAENRDMQASRMSALQGLHEDDDTDDDFMDIDEQYIEENEAKFARNKASLEAKKVDINSPYYCARDILQRIALLHNLTLHDLSSLMSAKADEEAAFAKEDLKADCNGQPRNSDDMLTPKTEEREEADDSVVDEANAGRDSPVGRRSVSLSPPPIGTPELRALPFVNQEPLTPMSQLDDFLDSADRHESVKTVVQMELADRTRSQFDAHQSTCIEYAKMYRMWRLEAREIEQEYAVHDKEEVVEEVAVPEPLPDVSPMLPTPTAEGRRSRYTSEYSLEQALKKSQETAKAEQLQREREAAQAKRDPDKEADLLEMLSGHTCGNLTFKDTTYRRDADLAVAYWQLQPPPDDFTQEEHKTMIENFRAYPKKWGKIAQALHGRTYKDCINHYYATKWDKEFKPKTKARAKSRAKGSAKLAGTAKSLRANHLLNDVGVDVYGAEDAAAPLVSRTTGGRPKRAAAPTTFEGGEKKAARPAGPGEQNSEKVARKSKGAPRSSGNQRKSGRQAARQRSASPPKPEAGLEVRQPDLGPAERYMPTIRDLAAGPPGMASIHSIPPPTMTMHTAQDMRYGTVQDLIAPAPGLSGLGDMRNPLASQSARAGPSSYWSVQETTKFPEYLETFGTDWQAIATHMGSKSATMVKNYYQRLLSSGRQDIAGIANRADEDRNRADKSLPDATGPVSTTSSPIKRRTDSANASLPRPLAPSRSGHPEIIDIEDDSPALTIPARSEIAPPRFGTYASASQGVSNVVPSLATSNPSHEPNQPRESVDWSQGIARSRVEREFGALSHHDRLSQRFGENIPAWDGFHSRGEESIRRPEQAPPLAPSEALFSSRALPADDRLAPRQSMNDRLWGSRSKPEILQPSPADHIGPTHSHLGHFNRQSPPPQARMPTFSPRPTPSYTPARPIDIGARDALRGVEARTSVPSTPFAHEAPHSRSGPSTPFFESGSRLGWGPGEDLRGPLQSAPTEDRMRSNLSSSTVGQPRVQTPASSAPPAKPKKSNLSALLNPEPEDPKPSRLPPPSSAAPMSRARTPPVYGSHLPPSRPASQLERPMEIYGDPRQAPGPFHGVPLARMSHGSPPMPSHEAGRSFPSLHERAPPVMQPSSQPGPQHPFLSSRPLDSPSILHRHNSIHSLRSPTNASPPPPQSYGYGQPTLHASARPGHSRQSPFSRPPAGPFAERRETYNDRPAYAAPAPAERRPYGEHGFGSSQVSSATTQAPTYEASYAPPANASRYGPPGRNIDAHSHNSTLLPGYAQGPRDPFSGRSCGESPFERERREREEADRSRQMGGGGPSQYGYVPGRR